MDTTAHFENISQAIAKRLNEATHEIVAAVAWFTDADLFEVLCKQAGRGLRVRLAVQKDQINIGPGKLNFQRLQDISSSHFDPGGLLFLTALAWNPDFERPLWPQCSEFR